VVLFWLDHGWVGEACPGAAARGDGAAVPVHGPACVRCVSLQRVLGRARLRPRPARGYAAPRDRATLLRGVCGGVAGEEVGVCAGGCVVSAPHDSFEGVGICRLEFYKKLGII